MVFLVMGANQSFAQNESLLPLFDQAKNYFVPALTGDKGKTSFYAIGGYQYFPNFSNDSFAQKSKTSFNIDFSSPFYKKWKHRLSAGVFYSYQENNKIIYSIINRNNFRVNLGCSYLSSRRTFSIGTFFDLTDMKTDLGSMQPGYTKKDNFSIQVCGSLTVPKMKFFILALQSIIFLNSYYR